VARLAAHAAHGIHLRAQKSYVCRDPGDISASAVRAGC
jgi:hypothetical protein